MNCVGLVPKVGVCVCVCVGGGLTMLADTVNFDDTTYTHVHRNN